MVWLSLGSYAAGFLAVVDLVCVGVWWTAVVVVVSSCIAKICSVFARQAPMILYSATAKVLPEQTKSCSRSKAQQLESSSRMYSTSTVAALVTPSVLLKRTTDGRWCCPAGSYSVLVGHKGAREIKRYLIESSTIEKRNLIT